MKKIIAVVGNARPPVGSLNEQIAFEVGKAIVDNGYRLQCGGLNGVMLAACKGAHASSNYKDGDVIGILPSFDISTANEYVDIAIPTGLDVYRNVIVASASAVIAVGGGAGTLCEIANAWALKKLVIGMTKATGWSAKLAGMSLDDRIRYPEYPEDQIYAANSTEEAMEYINKYIDGYDNVHKGITPSL